MSAQTLKLSMSFHSVVGSAFALVVSMLGMLGWLFILKVGEMAAVSLCENDTK